MNITQVTTDYIFAHPFVVEGLKKNIINYSKLSRTIAAEIGVFRPSDFDAILVACRRVADKLKEGRLRTQTVTKEIGEIKIEIENKKVIFSVGKEEYLKKSKELEKMIDVNVIEGERLVTIISEKNRLKQIQNLFPDSMAMQELSQITLHLSRNCSELYGVYSYFTSIFYDNNVNIVDLISLGKEILIFIAEKDIPKVIKYLKF